MVIPVSEQDY